MNEVGRRSALTLAGVGLLGVAGCSRKRDFDDEASDVETAQAPTTTPAPTATAPKGGGRGPVSLAIPSIGFDRKVRVRALTKRG